MSDRTDLRRELTLLVLSRYPLVVVESVEEAKVEELVRGVAADLGLPFFTWRSSEGLVAGGTPVAGSRDPDRALARLLANDGELVALLYDLGPYLERPEVVRRLRDAETAFAGGRSTLVLGGSEVGIPPSLDVAAARLTIELPDLEQLVALVRSTAKELAQQRRIRIDLSPREVEEIARALRGVDEAEARRLLYRAGLRDGVLAATDLPLILEGKRERVRQASTVEWVDTGVTLADLGGAEGFKSWIGRRRDAFTERARRFGLEPPRGVLLTGVPGTGKSLAARAVAGEWKLPLLRLDVGSLYDRYVGATEGNLRRALHTAEAMAPAVLWTDEVEKVLRAGSGASDDGLSQRILGALLTWMQERPAPVFLLATANDVGALPVELLRRGRFDEVFFFDLPDAPQRQRIFSLHLERRGRRPESFDLPALAAAAEGFSGAEIEGVVAAGLYRAFSEEAPLSTEMLLAEIAATRPLVEVRPRDIAALRAWGREHAVPA